ncbi:MAG: cell division protein SepF [Acidimicrobiia bacterium]|nr:cell division protein SepF [Acidimicrobiia bacterium]
MAAWRRAMVYLGLVDDEYPDDGYGDYYEDDLEPVEEPEPAPKARPARRQASEGGSVSVMRQGPARQGPARQGPAPAVAAESGPVPVARKVIPSVRPVMAPAAQVHVMEPTGFNDAQDLGDRLKSNQPVILNLQRVDRDLQRRLIDFSSGLAYALGGQMSKAADQVFLITPSNVEVSDEEKEQLQARGLYRPR